MLRLYLSAASVAFSNVGTDRNIDSSLLTVDSVRCVQTLANTTQETIVNRKQTLKFVLAGY